MKKWIQKHWPTIDTVSKKYPILFIFGKSIFHPKLWEFKRKSFGRGLAIGLFWSMIPMPFQMVPAAFLAIVLRVNLPIALAACWITNPITMAPIFFVNYRIGVFLLGIDAIDYDRVANIQNLKSITSILSELWLPLYSGSVFIGIIFALCGYIATILAWNFVIIRRRFSRNINRNKKRKEKRIVKKSILR